MFEAFQTTFIFVFYVYSISIETLLLIIVRGVFFLLQITAVAKVEQMRHLLTTSLAGNKTISIFFVKSFTKLIYYYLNRLKILVFLISNLVITLSFILIFVSFGVACVKLSYIFANFISFFPFFTSNLVFVRYF